MSIKKQIPTAAEIEVLVANMWGYRQNIVVPNVHWGAGLHECDMLILSKCGWASEIEIKVSKADLKKDSTKGHGHNSSKIKYLYFALPDFLCESEYIPQRAGIIAITPVYKGFGFYAKLIRHSEPNKAARKWDDKERANLMRLGCMRIWSLKSALIGRLNDLKQYREQSKELEPCKQH
jgi:hypothetical protein